MANTVAPKISPNLLLVMVDCLRADYFVGRRGRVPLPNIERLRRRGTTFTDFHAAATTTTPSTASLLSGLYPIRHGVRGHIGYRLMPGVQTLAERLKAAGYRTAARMTGPLGPETGLDRGFDSFTWRPANQTVFGSFGRDMLGELAGLQQGKQPWFYFLHIWALHMPLPAPWQDGLAFRFPTGTMFWKLQLLDNRVLAPAWRSLGRARPGTVSRSGAGSMNRPPANLWKQIGRRLMEWYKPTAYERTLRALDHSFFGPLLERMGPDSALVAVTGDHGEFVDVRRDRIGPEVQVHRRPNHSFHLYDYLTRVPLLLAGAGIPAGAERLTVGSHVDTAPTLLSALGLPYQPAEFDGQNLLSELPHDRPIFMEAVGGGPLTHNSYLRAVRSGDWKYIEAPGLRGHAGELYDLRDMPVESQNLVERQPEAAARLQKLLQDQFREDQDRPWDRKPGEAAMAEEDAQAVSDRLRDLGYLE